MAKKLDAQTRAAAAVVPSARQLAWQRLEFYAFLHFGMNTFTNSEWGTGREDPALFQPQALDCLQWAKIIRAAGMRGMLLTAKHHDGFCLWPTKTTEHSVASSPWREGRGDVVREAADAARAAGLAFGLYLSPWDMHAPSYGTGKAYDDFYLCQLRELLTNYGELFCVWLDGACGEGKNGRKQIYDMERYVALIRELQPNAVISVCGPDVRWCGNEAGVCRSSEWSVVPWYHSEAERVAAASQKEGGKPPKIDAAEPDLGSRKAIRKAGRLIWYPAEVDVSIRPGWFYHEKEDYAIKPLAKLREIYYKSVGANAAMLLNIPPTPEGKIHERDKDTLLSLGAQLKIDFKENLAEGGTLSATQSRDARHSAQMALDANPAHYWHSGAFGAPVELVLDLGEDFDINKVALQEHIESGQQIEKCSLWWDANLTGRGEPKWERLEKFTVVGHKRLIRFSERRMQRLKLVIEEARGFATLESFRAY
ncbi:MAG: alpha-L-fucosidase [Oscillospiraceae bacterium]|jgi:alpha-L-fucosidase|nr:alpha-L-fucosidase [Oscillospiraceae bacterium]